MPSDDELRRVAEDVRALARSLGRDIRTALDRARDDISGPPPAPGEGPAARRSAREDLASAGRAARDELRAAQLAVRDSARQHRRNRDEHRRAGYGPGGGCGPRSDNWGGPRHRGPAGGRPENAAPVGPRRRSDRRFDREVGPRTGWDGPEGGDDAERGVRHLAAAAPIRHRHDGTTLVGLLAVVFGLAWLVGATHLASVSTEVVLALALMVVGVATVITARTDWALSGRSWPVIAGAVVALALLASSASTGLPVGFRHIQFGSRTVAPSSWNDLPFVIHSGFGRTRVDLTSLPSPLPAARTLTIDNAAGRLEIMLPNVRVLLHAHIAAGQIQVDGFSTAGTGRSDIETLNPTAPAPPLSLNIDAGFGSVDVVTGGGSKPGANPASGSPLTPTAPTAPTVGPGPTVAPTSTVPGAALAPKAPTKAAIA